MRNLQRSQFYALKQQPSNGVSQIVSMSVDGNPTGGTFKLSFLRRVTGDIAHNAPASTIKSALESLPSIGEGNVRVSGTTTKTIEFIGALARRPLPAIELHTNALTGGTNPTVSLSITTPGVDSYPFGAPAGAIASVVSGSAWLNYGTDSEPDWSHLVFYRDMASAIFDALKFTLISGGNAGNHTVAGITTNDYLISVRQLDIDADTGSGATGNKIQDMADLTSQFSISGNNTISNAGGANTTGDKLLVVWAKTNLIT